MDFGYASLVGKVRHRDEDSLLVLLGTTVSEGKTVERALAAVADGMGGGEYGEVASRIAINSVRKVLGPLLFQENVRESVVRERMHGAFVNANEEILRYAGEHKLYLMGTTLTTSLFLEDKAIVGNIGDSRTYIINGEGETKLKTKDHSYVNELVEAGKITQEQVKGDLRRNELTRVLGVEENIRPDFYVTGLEHRDSILLCCDGLWGAIDEKEIMREIKSEIPAKKIVDTLAKKDEEKDGSDNISLVLIKL